MELEKKQAKESTKKQRSRSESVEKIIQFEQRASDLSQRQFCQIENIPRSTLRYWLARKQKLDADTALVNFFESPNGVAFLHRLMSALHFSFCKVGTASLHNLSEFLRLSGLSAFVASSYGSQQAFSEQMDEVIHTFSADQVPRLAAKMRPRTIPLCEDETFHPEICLVAMEPISNFIFLEQYAPDRTASTWNDHLSQALAPFPVQIHQVTSDEGTGLLNHVQKGLGVPHSPDLFHVVYDISKGCSAALNSIAKKAEKAYEKKKLITQKAQLKQQTALEKKTQASADYFSLFDELIERTQTLEKQAFDEYQQVCENQNTVQTARLEIGEIYHPYHLETGQAQTPEQVETRLESVFSKIYEATSSLSQRAKKRIDKAHRMIDKMKGTVAFFFLSIQICLKEANLTPELEKLMRTHWIPAFYFQTIAQKQKQKEERQKLEKLAWFHFQKVQQDRWAIQPYSFDKQQQLETLAKDCAQLFQRSSSCVEGRNAQLSLRHHHLHRLSKKKLSALTTIHNFHGKRGDGTTPAERFFEQKHENLFQWVLDHMSFPLRPRAKNRQYALAAGG